MAHRTLDELVYDMQVSVAPQQMGHALIPQATEELLGPPSVPSVGPLHTEDLSVANLTTLQQLNYTGNFNEFTGPDPKDPTQRDINIYRTNGDLIFSDWLSSSTSNAAAVQAPFATGFGSSTLFDSLDLDRLYLPIDLGITSFMPLGVAHTDPGVHVFFRAPRARAFWAPDPSGSGAIPFSTDAELALFTRDPRELTDTLWNDAPEDWVADASTLKNVAPMGEIAENSPPFEIPAVVVLPDRWQQLLLPGPHVHPYNSIKPVLSHYFGLADESNTRIGSTAWGSSARLPSGTGSIKAIRFLQYGPCDIQQDFTRILNQAKVQLVALLNYCGHVVRGFTFPAFQIHAFVARPYITRSSPNMPLANANAETKTGLLLFGHVTFGPVDVKFKVDLSFDLDDQGMLVVARSVEYRSSTQNPNALEDPKARILRDMIDGLLFTGGNIIVPLLGSDVASGAPWLWNGLPNLIQTSLHDQQVRPASEQGSIASIILFGKNPIADTRCHSATDPFGPMDCSMAAADLLILVVKGFTMFFGRPPRTTDELPAITATVMSNAHDLSQAGNWECDPDQNVFASVLANQGDPNAGKQCKFRLRAKRVTVHIDQIIMSPFFDFHDLESSSLMVFFAAYGLGVHNLICKRFDSSNLRQPGAGVNFFNRWYEGVTVNELGCDEHDPSLLVTSCKTASEKGSPTAPLFGPFYSDDCDGRDCVGGFCRRTIGSTAKTPPCQSDAACLPSESCGFGACRPNRSCEPDWDPFATLTSPFDASPHCPVGQFCNNGTCWRT